MDNLTKDIGLRIKDLRFYLKLSQSEMAVALNITQYQITRYETGQSKISIDLIVSIIKKYNISLNWLLLGIGNMFLPEQIFNNEEFKLDLLNLMQSINKILNKL